MKIFEISGTAAENGIMKPNFRNKKFFSKNFKKGIDKSEKVEYNINVDTLGRRQVVRQWTLTPLFRGFKSFRPNQIYEQPALFRKRKMQAVCFIKILIFTRKSLRSDDCITAIKVVVDIVRDESCPEAALSAYSA